MQSIQRAGEIYEDIVAIRRDLHQHPELSTKEFRTGEKIASHLDKCGIEYQTDWADTGIVGIIRGKKGEGRTVAARADIDALPIEESDGLPFRSVNRGIMHACGHDAHTAILLGAARILKNAEDDFGGTVKLFFQPAEETIGGAQRMIQAGCMENPRVDYTIGIHVMPDIPVGKVALKYGKLYANTTGLLIRVKGKSGHAAYPHTAIDAVTAAAQVISSLQQLVSRCVSPLDSVVLTFGMIHGGSKANIIADEVELTGTLRTLDDQTRSAAKERIEQIAVGTARALGAEADVSFENGYIALVNDEGVLNVIASAAERVVGSENIIYRESPSMGGEDFAYFGEEVPSAFYHIGCGSPEKGISAPLHSRDFKIDEHCLNIGMAMQVESILALLAS